MTRRYGVIDIGTRGVRLLIADASGDGSMRQIASEGDLGTLGAGMDAEGLLSEQSMQHVVAIVQKYKAMFVKHQVEESVVVCTQVVRIARNAEEFVQKLQQIIPNVIVLTPEQEAKYSFRAAYLAFHNRIQPADRVLVVDQGGGSVELSSGKQATKTIYTSLPIGTVALTAAMLEAPSLLEGYHRVDKMIRAALEANHALDVLNSEPPAFLFGMGSAIRKVAEAQAGNKNVHGHALSRAYIKDRVEAVQKQLALVSGTTARGSLQVDNDIVTAVCGLLTFYNVLQKYGGDKVTVCLETLRHGVLRSMALEDAKAARKT